MKKTNKLISILVVVAMLLSIVPMNLSVSAAPDTDYNGDTYTNTEPEYVASVTDADGNEIEGSPYLTFEEAATAAKANKNSTLKLLDNADGCYVRVNSPFTLDLNGYTLDMGDENFDIGSVLQGYDCHLTVTDTSETETGKVISASYSGVFFVAYSGSPGKLTVLNGTVEYNNEYGGAVTLENKGVVEIKGGTFKNNTAAELYINNWIDNFDGSVDISGGTFPDGFEMKVHSSDYTSTENYLTDLLADGCYYRDADDNIIEVADDAKIIEGFVQVKKGLDPEAEAKIRLSETEFEFTGEEVRPEIIVTLNGKEIEDNSLFNVTYENNVNVGTATVTVTGTEDSVFTGEVKREFTITPKVVDIIWSETTEFDYDGNAHSVTATYVDVNGETVNAVVENGTNTKAGEYTATASIADTNYVANEDTASIEYVIRIYINFSGTVTSFLSETDEITLRLYKEGDEENAYVTTVTGTNAEYVFESIANGTYTLEVSKQNHATRTYEVTVGEEVVTQDAKIHLLGDINGDGKIMLTDYAAILKHVKKTANLEGYELQCADVDGNGKVLLTDYAAVLRHVKKTESLW